MKHAIITGGLGFIGHHLWRELNDAGWSVTVIDDLSTVNKTYQSIRLSHQKQRTWHKGNAGDTKFIQRYVRGDESVLFHLASHPNQAAVAAQPKAACDNIVSVTNRLAHFCAANDMRMIYVSSSMVYGNWRTEAADESLPCSPTNLYGLFKKQSEEIVRMICDDYAIVRPSAVYGPRDNLNRVLCKWMRQARNGETIVVDDPDAVLDFTYVGDLVKGIILAGTATGNDIYNMTAGRAVSLSSAANLIKEITESSSNIRIGNGLPLDQPRRGRLDISKAESRLGWAPAVDLETGLVKLNAWMESWPS
jgi:nucleoside-diphosphate-sugar epimerase